MTRTTCLYLSEQDLYAAWRADPAVARTLLRRLALRVEHLVERLDALTGRSVRAGLATFLLERAGHSTDPFTLGASQEAVAQELGTVREVVVKTLRGLLREGLLERTGRATYRIRDHRRLRESVHDP